MAYALGLDFGTNSVRSLIVECATGRELGAATAAYPGGHQGVMLDRTDPYLSQQKAVTQTLPKRRPS